MPLYNYIDLVFKYRKSILSLILSLLSAFGITLFDNFLKADEIETNKQVARIYADVAAQQHNVINKTVVIEQKSDCSACYHLLKNHIEKDH